jgi:trimeric autotransporter adhesin
MVNDMKRILLAFGLLLACCSPTLAATCANTVLIVKDATTPTALTDPVPYVDAGDGSGNCVPAVLSRNLTSTTNALALGSASILNVPTPNQTSTVGLSITGLSGTGASLTLEASDDGGTTWVTANCITAVSGGIASVFSADNECRINQAGRSNFRLRVSTTGTSTNANIAYTMTPTPGGVFLSSSIPAGSATIGGVTVANGSNVVGGSTTDSPCTAPAAATACTIDAVVKAILNGVTSAIPAGTNTIGNVGQTSQYPVTAVPITASTTGTTAATTATLTNVTGHTTYICGFSIRANATAAVTGNSTVTGTISGTLNFTQWTAPLASGLGVTEMIFAPCVPASAVSTSIAVISAAPGTGGVVSVTAWGYSL